MQLKIMKNIIDSVRNRTIPLVFCYFDADKKDAKKRLYFLLSLTCIPLILGSIFLSKELISSMGGTLSGVIWGALGFSISFVYWLFLKDIKENIINLEQRKFNYFKHVYYGFSQEKQKLNPEEVQQLLQLSFSEDDFKFLSYEIKDKGYLTHDDVYAIYERILKETRHNNAQREEADRKNTNFQQFLIENKVIEQVIEKTVESTPLVSLLQSEHIHTKSFNSKSTL